MVKDFSKRPEMREQAQRIADFFTKKAMDNSSEGENMTPLKVQKLLYYAYSWRYSLQKERIFTDKIGAWEYGPVVADVYHELKKYGNYPIDELKTDPELLSSELKDYLNTIWHSYGEYSATKLSNMTHDEEPWKNARKSDNKIITDESLAKFYSEDNADSLLPPNTVITTKNGKKTLMKLNKETIEAISNEDFVPFDINDLK